MAWETAAIIGVPMLLDALSGILNIKKEKLQEYYDDSQAFRDYLNSLTRDLNGDVQNELYQVTPTTTPRFDIPWVTEELKKKQDALFTIKTKITDIQTKAHQSAQETWENSNEKLVSDLHYVTNPIGAAITNDRKRAMEAFQKRKKNEADKYTKETNQLVQSAIKTKNKPLRNNNPTYQTIQERKRNALPKEKQQ